MINTLEKAFKELGINGKEIQVLFVLLQEDSLKVQALAKKARLNRTTTYGILKSLSEQGLVSVNNQKGVTEYQSLTPEQLVSFINRKRSQLQERAEDIKKILPDLKKMQKHGDSLPKIRFFEGVEGIKQAYEDTLDNNHEKKLLDFTGTDAVFKLMGKEWVNYYVKKRAKLGIECTDIAPDTQWSRISKRKDPELLRITKLLPEKYTFDTEIDIYDDKVGIFSFSEKHPIALIIEDKKISDTLRKLFQYVDSTIN